MSDHIADLAESYVHELLEEPTAVVVKAHCETCHVCKEAVDQARNRLTRLKAVASETASPQLIQTTLKKVGHDVLRRRWRLRVGLGALGTVAAAALLLLCLNAYIQHMEATPYDLVLLGQRELLAASNVSMRVHLLDRKNNRPVAGAPVTIELLHPETRKTEQVVTCTTDAQGNGQPAFHLIDTDGNFDLRVTAQTPNGLEVLEEKVRIVRAWKIMLTSDKPVYQPGQMIHLRALALRRLNLLPAAEQPAVFTIADPRNNVIFKDELKTSRFGIAATDCQLASEILEGDYVVTCKIGDTQTRLLVEVKKYVLPKFKVDVAFDRPFYQPGDHVKATVRADYFFGKPVANGAVEIGLTGAETKKWTEHTDEKGTFALDYDIPKKTAENGDASLEFMVKVTDSAGQHVSQTAERRVTRSAVRLDVIPENGLVVAGVPNRVYLLTSTADGLPVSLRILASIDDQELRTETNDRGAGFFDIVPKKNCVATVRALLPKSFGVRATMGSGLDAGRGLDGEGTVLVRKRVDLSAGAIANDFLLRTDKAVYTAGDLLKVLTLSSGDEPIFVDLIKEGQTVLSETIVPNFNSVGSPGPIHARGACQFQVPLELAGTLELCAYRPNGDRMVHKTRVVYVRAPEEVQITTTISEQPYRPGQQATLNFRLSDAKGQPVQGALSLAAVDEAVFAVMRQRPGVERDFYSVNPELLAAVSKLGGWSPARERGVEPRQSEVREQALFSTTATVMSHEDRHHTLSDSTYLPKVYQVMYRQGDWRAWIELGWVVTVIVAFVLGYGLSWLIVPKKVFVSIHPLLFMFLILGVRTYYYMQPRYDEAPGVNKLVSARTVVTAKTLKDMRSMIILDGTDSMADTYYKDKSTPAGETALPEEWSARRDGAVRIREYFPETLRWEPQLITDEQGRARLDLELADSITSWRLSASAVTADGRLGATQKPLKVFQPFFVDLNLPVALTRGDEVAVPVVVYNYLDREQTVVLKLSDGDWFTRLEDGEKRIDLPPGKVLATSYRLRVEKVGDHGLTVTARGGDVMDAIKRQIAVLPNGRRFEEVANGTLQEPVSVALDLPKNAVEGSAKAIVKIYPSSFSQLVEGLDGIFRMPSGCFEQTSSTTYPNILALDYLRKTGQKNAELEKRADQYIHLGYQRLLSFEVPGGGYDWFGRAPANRTLTAYGLMEFEDMARVHPIDPNVIVRTRDWLLKQRNKDGSWTPEGHVPHDALQLSGDESDAYLAATAFVAWAVFADAKTPDANGRTRAFLLSYSPEEVKNPYTLALMCNALLQLDPAAAKKYLDRLEQLKTTEKQGQIAHWSQPQNARTTFYGSGRCGNVETTALAALALQHDADHRATANAALAWLVTQKDARGTWYSTQATVLSLKALLGGMTPGGNDKERRVLVKLDDQVVEELVIPANRSEVMAQLDLSQHLKPGRRVLTLKETTDTAAGFQVMFRYHVDDAVQPDKADLLAVDLNYERTEVVVGDVVKVKAKVLNRMEESAAMVMLELPVPAGFAVVLDEVDKLQEKGVAAKFQMLPQSVLLYLRDLPAGKPLEVTYQLRATMAANVTAAGARVYEYYDPDRQGSSPAVRLTVKPGQ